LLAFATPVVPVRVMHGALCGADAFRFPWRGAVEGVH
jgi:hypothetical protein